MVKALKECSKDLDIALLNYDDFREKTHVDIGSIILLLSLPLILIYMPYCMDPHLTIYIYPMFLLIFIFVYKYCPILTSSNQYEEFFHLAKDKDFFNLTERDMYQLILMSVKYDEKQNLIRLFSQYDTDYMRKTLRHFRLFGYGTNNIDELNSISSLFLSMQAVLNEKMFFENKKFIPVTDFLAMRPLLNSCKTLESLYGLLDLMEEKQFDYSNFKISSEEDKYYLGQYKKFGLIWLCEKKVSCIHFVDPLKSKMVSLDPKIIYDNIINNLW